MNQHKTNFAKLSKRFAGSRLKRFLLFISLPFWVLLILLFIPVRTLFHDPTSTVILARNGELLGAKIAADGQWRFPPRQSVPEKFEKAVIAFEDKRFYYHPGVDPIAIVRSMRMNLRSGSKVSGASTLTMQVVRLSRKGKPRTVSEKIIEAFISLRLEIWFSKQEILSMYASNAPFGGNVVGLDAAAWRYFGRSGGDLSWAEAAALAVLPNAPALVHPGRNRNIFLQKRNRLLEKLMLRQVITREDYELALLEPLPERPLSLPMHAMHLLERANRQAPGTISQTSLDGPLQQNAVRVVAAHVAQNRHQQIHNAAALILDNRSGKVLAYVGNAYHADLSVPGGMVDIITAPRSGGSILKPFLFAAMLHEGLITPQTLIPDYPFQTPGFNPQNFDRRFDGAVPAYRALQRSLNVPAVRMLQQYGVEKFHFLLGQLGMTTLNHPPLHYGLSLILGGAESSLWDVAAMYARLSRVLQNYPRYDGLYDPNDLFQPGWTLGSENEQKTRHPEQRHELEASGVLDASAIWATYQALLEVNRPEEEAGWQLFANVRRIAWKTGTSYGNRDAWAVGTTPEYTVGVWVGNASGEGRPNLTGVGFAAPILFELFGLLPATTTFPQPYDDMVQAELCRQSGHIAGRFCVEKDSVWMPVKCLRTTACSYHIPVHLDQEGKHRVNSSCYDVHRMQTLSWFVLPPAMEWFYRSRNPGFLPLPPWLESCRYSQETNPMQLIYPSGNVKVIIPRELGGEAGKMVLQAVHREREALIFWHLDGEFLGSTHYEHNFAITTSPGIKHLVLVDENGHRLEQEFQVVQSPGL